MQAAPTATATSLLLNLSQPSQVAHAAALDVDGVGLLRAALVSRVPGVVRVHSKLAWTDDDTEC